MQPAATEQSAPATVSKSDFEPIPAIDLLAGRVVRLRQGDFSEITDYGDPEDVIASWKPDRGGRVHVVDLEGARSGRPHELDTVRRLSRFGFRLQAGGGVRSVGDAKAWLDAGAEKVVIGTTAAAEPQTFAKIVQALGAPRILPAVDLKDGAVFTAGWQTAVTADLTRLFASFESMGMREVLVTDIRRDGMLSGPSLDFYRRLALTTRLRIIASGGVANLGDIASLSRLDGLSGVVLGKSLHEKRFTLPEARARAASARFIPERVIPCLDLQGGRVVKGTRFTDLRDAGDPVECAKRYEREGADELVVLDISATQEERATSMATVERIAETLFIPLTVGGGVRTLEDFGRLIRSGADRVAMNSAAVERPSLLEEAAAAFGRQAVVLACDARSVGRDYRVVVRGGTVITPLEVSEWCRSAETLGAGEILLTSIDRDGTGQGFDLELLRRVTTAVKIGVIASGGAGKLEHFSEAIETGGARAVLAASLFHDGILSIGELKDHLSARGIPVRTLERQ